MTDMSDLMIVLIEEMEEGINPDHSDIREVIELARKQSIELAVAKAEIGRLRDAVWTVSDTETAAAVLVQLGIGCDASLEPGADWRRDKVAVIIGSRREAAIAAARNKALDEAAGVILHRGRLSGGITTTWSVLAVLEALKEQG